MIIINTNVGALLARNQASRFAERMQISMEHLSPGERKISSNDLSHQR